MYNSCVISVNLSTDLPPKSRFMLYIVLYLSLFFVILRVILVLIFVLRFSGLF